MLIKQLNRTDILKLKNVTRFPVDKNLMNNYDVLRVNETQYICGFLIFSLD